MVVGIVLGCGVMPCAAEEPVAGSIQERQSQWETQAREQEALGRWDRVVAIRQKQARLNPHDPVFWSRLGAARLRAGDPEEACADFGRAALLAGAASPFGPGIQAEPLFDAWVRRQPEDWRALYCRGVARVSAF
jgi:hypothetical protein